MYATAFVHERSRFATQPTQSSIERENSSTTGRFRVLTSAFMVGTLGIATPTFVEKRSGTATWNVVVASSQSRANAEVARDWVRSPADNLEHIRTVLKVGVTDLAAAFGVARQALYNWRAGNSISPENAAKLGDLAEAADLLAAAGLADTPQLLRRKLAGSKTLLEIAQEGGSAKDAARALVQMVEHEIAQRKMLDARLAKRKRVAIDAADIGLPMLDEGV